MIIYYLKDLEHFQDGEFWRLREMTDYKRGRFKILFSTSGGTYTSVTFSPTGRYLAGIVTSTSGKDSTIKIYDLESPHPDHPVTFSHPGGTPAYL
jgi:WD40 repeat protein